MNRPGTAPIQVMLPYLSEPHLRSRIGKTVSLAIVSTTTISIVEAGHAAPLHSSVTGQIRQATSIPIAASAAMRIPRFHKFETSFTLSDQTGNPFDPADNDVDAVIVTPAGPSVVVPAFWDGSRWKVRYTPLAVGAYTLSITRNGHGEAPKDLTADTFECVSSKDAGFIRIDPGQEFRFENGVPYYPLGMNVAWTGGNGPDYPAYLTSMGANHMNWARVWMTFWDGKALEWSPDKNKNPKTGYLLMDAAERWDAIFDQAEQHGVYIQMVLQHHGQYTNRTNPNWSENPFNVANGGFLKNPDDFFTDPDARRLTQAKYRYIVARWGYSTHLLAFELFNEVQNIGEAHDHFQDVVNWHKEMAAYLRVIDINHHLITTSISDPGSPLAQIGLDYDQSHTYPPDLITTFAGTRPQKGDRPLFYGEWGPDTGHGDAAEEQQLHDGLWASMMAPTAGAGQFWSWDHVIQGNWWPQFASATGFVQTCGLAKLTGSTAISPAVTAPGARGDLSFAPPGGWEPTKKFDVTLSPDGTMPDLLGVSSFIQGQANRNLMAQPIVFHVNCPETSQFQVLVGGISGSGGTAALSVDGGAPQTLNCPGGTHGDFGQTLSVDVPVGQHTVTLDNTGSDWFIAKKITITNYVPSMAVLAKGTRNSVAFWAYSRDRHAPLAQGATIGFPTLAPGRYQVILWNTIDGRNAQTFDQAAGQTDGMTITLTSSKPDIAGIIVPVH